MSEGLGCQDCAPEEGAIYPEYVAPPTNVKAPLATRTGCDTELSRAIFTGGKGTEASVMLVGAAPRLLSSALLCLGFSEIRDSEKFCSQDAVTRRSRLIRVCISALVMKPVYEVQACTSLALELIDVLAFHLHRG